jgi:hypothetical protein
VTDENQVHDQGRDPHGVAAAMQAAIRDEGPQFALPLVIRVDRSAPPARTDALEGAAQAVLRFLSDPRVTGVDGVDGEWTAVERAWEDARIRKVVRRARGAAWERARALPGITVDRGTAEIRVYPPVPVDDWPADLAKLQVSGTDLEDPAPPADVPDGVPVLWLNPELPMSTGKAMAQVGHGVQLAWWELEPTVRSTWILTFGCGRPESASGRNCWQAGCRSSPTADSPRWRPDRPRWSRIIRRYGRG